MQNIEHQKGAGRPSTRGTGLYVSQGWIGSNLVELAWGAVPGLLSVRFPRQTAGCHPSDSNAPGNRRRLYVRGLILKAAPIAYREVQAERAGERERLRGLIARADVQHRQVMAGDELGMWGGA